jgi:hypothetical protein
MGVLAVEADCYKQRTAHRSSLIAVIYNNGSESRTGGVLVGARGGANLMNSPAITITGGSNSA